MGRSRWCCSSCGATFTRATSCRRHIASRHSDALAVTETEYIIGRVSGRFAVPPPFSRGPPTFQKQESGEKPSLLQRAAEEAFIEFWKAMARSFSEKKAQHELPSRDGKACYYQPQQVFPEILKGSLFGSQLYICNRCFGIKQRNLYFVIGEQGGLIMSPTYCPGITPELLINTGLTPEKYIERFSKLFLPLLKEIIDAWTGESYSLASLEIDPSIIINSKYELSAQGGTSGIKKSITLPFSEEKCIDMIPLRNWAQRVIQNAKTTINETELMEFLGMTRDSTFGFFKVMLNGISHTYLLAIMKGEETTKKEIKSVPPAQISAAKEQASVSKSSEKTNSKDAADQLPKQLVTA